MTNGNGFIDQAARRAQALPMARIVAAMLGAAAAFFALAMPPRIVSGLLGLTGMSVAVGMAGQLIFAILFAGLTAAAGWLAMTLLAGNTVPAPVVAAPAPPRKRPIGAKSSDPAPTLRKGDAHPDAPARRPIFAKDDLGTPFDEIVTDRRIIRGAPEADFATPDAPVDLDSAVIAPPPAAEKPAAETSVVVAEAEAPAVQATPVIDEPAAEEIAPVPAEAAAEIDESPAEIVDEQPIDPPAPRAGTRPAAPREDDSIATLMARFEGGLSRLGGGTLPPPDLSSISTLKRSGRNPDDALRDALEALQRMAARQR